MTRKTASIGVRLTAKVKEAADKFAADDHRSLSSLIEKLLFEHLKAHGYLKEEPEPAQEMPDDAEEKPEEVPKRESAPSAAQAPAAEAVEAPKAAGKPRKKKPL